MSWGGRTRRHGTGARAAITIASLGAFTPFSPVACGPVAGAQRPPTWAAASATAGDASRLRLGDSQQKATHNSYARDERLVAQIADHRVRAVELDVHVDHLFRPEIEGDWYVYHVDLPGFGRTSCDRLSSCLAELGAWHRAAPGHDVLTVFVDVKDRFATAHAPSDLDERLEDALGRDALYRPEDAIARCPGATSLGEATRRCGWPTLGELAGKVVVAVTGGTVCDAGTAAEYVAEGAMARAAFAAPNLDASCPIEATQAFAGGVALANLPFDERGRVATARARGLLTRVYYGGLVGGLDDADAWSAAAATGATYLATDAVDAARAPWAVATLAPAPAFRALPRADAVADGAP